MKTNFLILITGVTLIIFQSCRHKEHKNEALVKCVATYPVVKDTVIEHPYVCQIQAVQHIEIRALEKGYLQNIYVDEGQFIKKGTLMFQIMPALYQAETQKAQAEVNFATIEYQNTKRLADSGIVSKNELALAKAKLDKAKAELELAKTHLSFTEIKAPFDGIMDRFHVRLGSLVEEGELLTTLSDNSKMWAYFNVPEAEYLNYITSRKQNKEPVKVRLKMANNELFDQEGIIETIEADFNTETGNIAFRAGFSNPNRILRHGETGMILMPVQIKNALLIPQKAVFEILDKKYVYTVDEQGIVHSKLISISAEMPHVYVVSKGLTERDRVIVQGIRKVKNNQKVQCEMQDFYSIIKNLNELHAE
ncbi:MAG: efflux RND transporter periplasmic adaptor subunit [Bacteroidia bacterium]|nr:efflux RND transporter periplasmic adaptor subunit [Bacteroidia bacterium]MDW8302192.1 efflux RND transporter periplasmic adaptor subunit [Bacteroidia bacterium]